MLNTKVTKFVSALTLTSVWSLAACSSTPMRGQVGRAKSDSPAAPTTPSPSPTPESPTSPSPSPEPGNGGDTQPPELPAGPLGTCVESWPGHPFTADQLAAPVVLTVNQSNGNNGVALSDQEVSTTPRLVLVNATSKNVNSSILELLDPNGWYCVDVSSMNANNFSIRAHCTAVIATLDQTNHVANNFLIQRVGC